MRIVFVFICLFVVLSAEAQEGLQVLLPEMDSVQLENERKILYQQLLSGTINSGGLDQDFSISDFSFTSDIYTLDKYKIPAFSFDDIKYNQFTNDAFFFVPSPFFSNGAILSGSEYKINEKFKMGGYSFGANSIFSAPLPNKGMNKFDTRGSSFYMQYKVSKNIKIETRVSVSQGPGY